MNKKYAKVGLIVVDAAAVKILKKILIDYEITQVEIADALEISKSTVSKVINGCGVSGRVMRYICKRVGVDSVDELYKLEPKHIDLIA